ncbi:hypothetical protein RIVM261_001320 [Rivularia sp. IAM M-261]|nr:hypothetical protein RIVM261_001320 [Rivularia sp. IAM M-261]
MTKSTLFVCKSCCISEDHPENQPADGAVLLEKVQTHQSNNPEFNNIRVQPTSCLWDCGRGCVIAFSASRKPTYVFSAVTPESAPGLLQFAQKYTQSKTGNISYDKFPEELKEIPIAKVPAITHEAPESE